MAIDDTGQLWVVNLDSDSTFNSGLGSVASFDLSTLQPSGAGIYGSAAVENPSHLAVDSKGNIWLTNNAGGFGQIVTELVQASAYTATTFNFATMFGTGATYTGVAADSSGNVFFGNGGTQFVLELPGAANGTTGLPGDAQQVMGSFLTANPAGLLVVDPSGNLWGTLQGASGGFVASAAGGFTTGSNFLAAVPTGTLSLLIGLERAPHGSPMSLAGRLPSSGPAVWASPE
jgi:streptogramin lyase